MKVAHQAWRRCALAVVAGLFAVPAAAAQPEGPPLPDAARVQAMYGHGGGAAMPPFKKTPAIFDNDLANVSYESECGPVACYADECDCPTGDCELPGHGNDGFWYGGVEFLLVKTHLSNDVAFVNHNVLNDGTTTTTTDTAVEYQHDYQGSFRLNFGRRLCECGGDVQFTYWRLQGDSNQAISNTADTTNNISSAGQLLVNTVNSGDRLFASSSVNVDVFDIELSKCLPIGGPNGDCADCGCPLLDLRWSVGLRGANVNRRDENFLQNANGSSLTTADVKMDFAGVGPRAGLAARRYFGPCAALSLYAKGNMSLLLGDYSVTRTRFTPNPPTVGGTGTRTVQNDDFARVVPVTEIEVGGSWQVKQSKTFISAGWLVQAWWDLGSSQQITSTTFGPVSSSNILGFDGFFLRMDRLF